MRNSNTTRILNILLIVLLRLTFICFICAQFSRKTALVKYWLSAINHLPCGSTKEGRKKGKEWNARNGERKKNTGRKEIRKGGYFIITKLGLLCTKRTETCQYPFKQFCSSEARILSTYSRLSGWRPALERYYWSLLNSPIRISQNFH